METRSAEIFNTMTGLASSLTVNSAFVLVSDHAPHSCVTTSMTFRDATGYTLSFHALFMYVIDKFFNRTSLRTTIQMSTKIVSVTLSKSRSLFALLY